MEDILLLKKDNRRNMQKFILHTLLIVISVSHYGCLKDLFGLNEKKYLWKTNISDFANFTDDTTDIPFFFNELPLSSGNVIVPGIFGGKYYYLLMDINNGEVMRRIEGETRGGYGVFGTNCIKADEWYYTHRKTIKKINLSNGEMQVVASWEGNALFHGELYSVDNLLFWTSDFGELQKVYYLDLSSNPNIDTLPIFSHQTENVLSYSETPYNISLGYIHPLKNAIGQRMVLIIYIEPDDSTDIYKYAYKASLYNMDEQAWEYDGSDFLNIQSDTISDFRHYARLDFDFQRGIQKVFGIDALSGKHFFLESLDNGAEQILYYSNKLYVSQSSGNIIVFDARTGARLFEIEAHGGTSVLKILHGVLYFVSRDYNLRAADAETGKTLWNIPSPDESPFSLFATSIGVAEGRDGKKGFIIVQNYKNAYCYEAIR